MSEVNFLHILIPFNNNPINILLTLQSFVIKNWELDKKHYVFKPRFETDDFRNITLNFKDNIGNSRIIHIDITRDPFIKNPCVVLKIIDDTESRYCIKRIHDYLHENRIIGSLISLNDGKSWQTTCDFF